MAKENVALAIIEEGVDTEVSTESFGCCWSLFTYLEVTWP